MTKTEKIKNLIYGKSENEIGKLLLGRQCYYEHCSALEGNYPHVEVFSKNWKRKLGIIVCTWLNIR